MHRLPNLTPAMANLLVAATAENAAPPDLRTPVPEIHLAGNLDEG